MAFGQGISVTALQLASAMCAIGNGGVLMKPHVVRCLVNKAGAVVNQFEPVALRQVISPETARRVTSILTGVVGGEGGTGRNAHIVNLPVAGKTGTSQKFDFSTGRYSSKKVATSFVGFFPADDPQMVILVVLDEPKIDRWGGVAAAPVFKRVSEQILRCSNSSMEVPEITAEQDNPSPQIIPVSTTADITRLETIVDESVIPDFAGLSLREVLRVSQRRGIEIRTAGSGWVVTQNPVPGTPIEGNQPCYILFGTGG